MEESRLLFYLNGELTEQECLEVEDWVAQSEANRHRLTQIYYTSHLAKCVDAYENANVEAALDNFRKRLSGKKEESVETVLLSSSRTVWWKRYGSLAAAFFAGLVLAAGILFNMKGADAAYEATTQNGQRAKIVLPDGTSVWLNSSTRLAYESGRFLGKREVELVGEAYFEVEKNGSRPFVVNSKGVRTKVLGTKFNVRAREKEQQVVTTLFQGSVQMFPDLNKKKNVQLSPGQTFSVNTVTGKTNLHAFNHPEDVLLWIKGELRFENKSLGEIMECLSKVYNVEVSFEDLSLREQRFTCLFKTDTPLEEVMSTLALTKHFSYELIDSLVTIKPIE